MIGLTISTAFIWQLWSIIEVHCLRNDIGCTNKPNNTKLMLLYPVTFTVEVIRIVIHKQQDGALQL